MSKATYRFPGEVVPVTNGGSAAIEPGDIVSLTTRVGVAAALIPVGETGMVSVCGVYTFPKATGAISQGDAVYFSMSSKKITKTDTDVPAGWATEAAASGDETVSVKIG